MIHDHIMFAVINDLIFWFFSVIPHIFKSWTSDHPSLLTHKTDQTSKFEHSRSQHPDIYDIESIKLKHWSVSP